MEDKYFCRKLDQYFSNYSLRFRLNFQISTCVGEQINVVAYHDMAEKILDVNIHELERYSKLQTQEFEKIFVKSLFQTKIFFISAERSFYNDELKTNYVLKHMENIDFDKQLQYFKQKLNNMKLSTKESSNKRRKKN